MSETTDAALSMAEGILRAAIRQGQDAFSVDPTFVADVIAELRRFRSGEWVQIPKSMRHAEAMNLVSEKYIKDNAVGKTAPEPPGNP